MKRVHTNVLEYDLSYDLEAVHHQARDWLIHATDNQMLYAVRLRPVYKANAAWRLLTSS